MAEQTNFYAVQRGAPGSFQPVSDRFINLYLHTNIHTGQGQVLDVPLCENHPCNELCFAHFRAKIQNIKKKKKQEKAHCLFEKSRTLQIFFMVLL